MDYLDNIRYYCLVMSEDYIRNHLADIKRYASVIENRLDDEWCTLETVLRDNAQVLELYSMETHNMCLEAIKQRGLKRKEDDWCFERYNCPRFTTPDEKGNVILDYGLAIEG